MITYVIEDTIESFFTAIYLHYYDKPADLIIRKKDYKPNLVDTPIYINEDENLYLKSLNGIKRTFSSEAMKTIFYGLKNSNEKAPNIIFNFIKVGMKNKSKIHEAFHLAEVSKAINLKQQVSLEAHRMTGFVRFSLVNEILISKISPDHDILEFISSHFKSRYKNNPFIIYDAQRRKALTYNLKECIIVENIDIKDSLTNTDEYQKIWQGYFKHLCIDERKNKKTQNNSLPIRYRNNMDEFF